YFMISHAAIGISPIGDERNLVAFDLRIEGGVLDAQVPRCTSLIAAASYQSGADEIGLKALDLIVKAQLSFAIWRLSLSDRFDCVQKIEHNLFERVEPTVKSFFTQKIRSLRAMCRQKIFRSPRYCAAHLFPPPRN